MLLLAAALLAVGSPLPDLKGDYLDSKPAVLPADCRGKVSLLLFGFTYDSRFAVEAWSKAWVEKYPTGARTTFFEIPMLGGMARLGRVFIDSGMRRGTPKALHRNVVTVYGGVDPWKKRLGFQAPNDAYVVLLDPEGRVLWLHQGKPDPEAWAQLVRAADASLKSLP